MISHGRISFSPRPASAAAVLFLAWVAAAAATGDLDLSLELEHTSLLVFEPIHAFGKVVNHSGETFVAGDPESGLNSVLRLVVERFPRDQVPFREDRPKLDDLVVAHGVPEPVHFDLSKHYDLARTGKYAAWLEIQWRGEVYRSNKVLFDIVHGIELQRTTRTVPGCPDLQWTYSLRYWARSDRGRPAEFLFLAVDDEKNETNYGVFQLGRIIRVFKPEMEIDPDGLIRVVHQTGQDCYARSTLAASGSGVYFLDQTYHLPNGDTYPMDDGRNSGEKVLVNPQPVSNEFFLKRWFRKRFSHTEAVDK